jgi:hypothetical protein
MQGDQPRHDQRIHDAFGDLVAVAVENGRVVIRWPTLRTSISERMKRRGLPLAPVYSMSR